MSRTSWNPRRMLGSAALACTLLITSAVPAFGAVSLSPAVSATVTHSTTIAPDVPAAERSVPLMAVPRVSGAAQVGSTLTAQIDAPARSTLQWYRDGVPISGATDSAYKLTLNDACTHVSVGVTPPAGADEQSRTSEPVGPVQLTASHVSVPTVSGTPAVGKVLRAVPGRWPDGTTLSYQWLRDGTSIPGATGSTYAVTHSDRGRGVTVRISGSVHGCALPASTSRGGSVALVAAGTLTASTPKISGTPKVDHKLTATVGTWTAGATLKYQWYRSGATIKGATAKAYTATTSDRGKVLTVKVTGSKAGYTLKSVTSAKTKAVTAGTLSAPAPKISGTPKVGYKLTVGVGKWTTGTTMKYQWLRNGSGIKGATGKTYTATASDRGKVLTVRVAGSKTGYASKSVTSAKTRAVAAGTLRSAVPKVSGTAKAGKKLAVSRGSWTSGTKLTQRWYRNGAAISGATATSYTLKSADAGKTISVRVTGSRSGYTTVTKASAGVRVQAAPKPAAKPKPSGAARPSGKNTCPKSHPVKGNGNSGIYHVPGGRHYAKTNPEECFKSAAAARSAGYRASQNG